VIDEPLQLGWSVGFSNRQSTPNLHPHALEAAECAEWARWVERVAAERTLGIEIAIRRTIRAATERNDPLDALIDSVIAWENLVGSSQGEPTLRISAALAWLLGQSRAERDAIQGEIKKLYGLRSKIVHGADAPRAEIAAERSGRARDLTRMHGQGPSRPRPVEVAARRHSRLRPKLVFRAWLDRNGEFSPGAAAGEVSDGVCGVLERVDGVERGLDGAAFE
jgi:hypothetical protein